MICFEIEDGFPWSIINCSKITDVDFDDNCVTFYCECGVFSINWTKTDLRDEEKMKTEPCTAKKSPGCCLEHYGCGDQFCGDCYPIQRVNVTLDINEIIGQCIKNITHIQKDEFRIELTNNKIINCTIGSTTEHDLFVFLGEISL